MNCLTLKQFNIEPIAQKPVLSIVVAVQPSMPRYVMGKEPVHPCVLEDEPYSIGLAENIMT